MCAKDGGRRGASSASSKCIGIHSSGTGLERQALANMWKKRGGERLDDKSWASRLYSTCLIGRNFSNGNKMWSLGWLYFMDFLFGQLRFKKVRQDSLIHLPWLTDTWTFSATIHWYVCHDSNLLSLDNQHRTSLSYLLHYSLISAAQLIDTCAMNDWYVYHDSLVCVPWLKPFNI